MLRMVFETRANLPFGALKLIGAKQVALALPKCLPSSLSICLSLSLFLLVVSSSRNTSSARGERRKISSNHYWIGKTTLEEPLRRRESKLGSCQRKTREKLKELL